MHSSLLQTSTQIVHYPEPLFGVCIVLIKKGIHPLLVLYSGILK